MRQAEVYRNGILSGHLIETDQRSYIFRYTEDYYNDPNQQAISLTLPKSNKEYTSEYLFPFFFNNLSEGVNRKIQYRTHQLDENDHFGLLLATTIDDTIGAITLKPINS